MQRMLRLGAHWEHACCAAAPRGAGRLSAGERFLLARGPLDFPAGPLAGCRWASTDGPFRALKPNFVDRKKHYNELLIFADRRKVMETAQEVLGAPGKEFPFAFWEVWAKRCNQSVHLLNPLELAMVARAFDMHNVKLRRELDVYHRIATQARASSGFPAIAVLVMLDVLPRRLKVVKAELEELLRLLSRRAVEVMWEFSALQALTVLEAITAAGIRDEVLCGRVAAKLMAHLQGPPEAALRVEELARAAAAMAGQEHRDLGLLRCLAERAAALVDQEEPAPAGAAAAGGLLESFAALGIEGPPAALERAAAAASRPGL